MRSRTIMISVAALFFVATLPARADVADSKLAKKLEDARTVYHELFQEPDRAAPEALVQNCRCVAVIPGVIKGAFGWGARFGQGVVSCRNDAGAWSPPAFLRLTGGSFGLQIGAEKSDVVLFFMTERGAKSLLESKFTLGGQLSVAAGPVGRTGAASTDLKLDAEIYSYAKSKGLFAGISLEGARLAPDDKAIAEYYGKAVAVQSLLFDHEAPRVPAEAEAFRKELTVTPVGMLTR